MVEELPSYFNKTEDTVYKEQIFPKGKIAMKEFLNNPENRLIPYTIRYKHMYNMFFKVDNKNNNISLNGTTQNLNDTAVQYNSTFKVVYEDLAGFIVHLSFHTVQNEE